MKNRRLLPLLFATAAAFFCLATQAQHRSYKKLWTAVEQARANDLPRTALEHLDAISRKAGGEGNDVEMLRALIARHTFAGDIATDSAGAERRRIEHALARETKPEMKALWHSALGMLHDRQPRLDTLARRKRLEHFAASLAQPEVLAAARAADYVPALVLGDESAAFGGDLLHVVGRTALEHLPASPTSAALRDSIFRMLITHYEQRGMRGATLLLRIDSIERSSVWKSTPLEAQSNFIALCALKDAHRGMAENVHTYIALSRLASQSAHDDSLLTHLLQEGLAAHKRSPFAANLRTAIARMEQGSISVNGDYGCLIPNADIRLAVRHQAIKRAEIRIYDGKKRIATHRLPLSRREAWATAVDSVSIRIDAPGTYRAALFVDGREADSAPLAVSRVMPLHISVSPSHHRITAVDVVTGAPLRDATLLLRNKDGVIVKTYENDGAGNFTVLSKFARNYDLLLQTPTDKGAPAFRLPANWLGSGSGTDRENIEIRLFTDRAIYRPGQTLCFGGFAYVQNDDCAAVKKDYGICIELVDSHGQTLATDTVVTDAFGNVHGTLTLPKKLLNGLCNLKANGRWLNSLRIEEYKRPTFSAEIETPTTGYKAGDTVTLTGRAMTFNGLPLEGAAVRCNVQMGRLVAHSETTDADGRFTVCVVPEAEETFFLTRAFIRRSTRVTAAVTAENGETAEAEQTLWFSNRPAFVSADWEGVICKEAGRAVNVSLTNPSGTPLTAQGGYAVCDRTGKVVAEGSFTTGTPFVPEALLALPSGEYDIRTFTAHPGVDTVDCRVLLFSKKDTRPAAHTPLWLYVSGDPATKQEILVGSSLKGATLFCDVFSGDALIGSRRIALNDTLLDMHIAYEPQHGDGARFVFSLVHDGRLHTESVETRRPQPEKKLQLRWQTFRSQLRPGEHEEWRLEVTTADGQPADAAVMATLYDASLDAFEKNPWHFDLHFFRRVPFVMPQTSDNVWRSLGKTFEPKHTAVRTPDFSRWDNTLFSLHSNTVSTMRLAGGSKNILHSVRVSPMMTTANAYGTTLKVRASQGMAKAESMDAAAEESGAQADATRKNFAETAFFKPVLRTDRNGVALIAFTLPESLTAWNFRAIAHTTTMDYGQTDTTVVARKAFSAQLATPRFLSKGDRIMLPGTLRNLTDAETAGTLTLVIEDAENGKRLDTQRKKFALNAQATATAHFEITVPSGAKAIIVRLTADAGAFADGEEHLIPILDDRIRVTKSLSIEPAETGTVSVRIDTLWSHSKNAADKTLVVEMTDNPIWGLLTSVPAQNEPGCNDAIAWATNLYVAEMGRIIGSTHPRIAEEARLRAEVAAQSDWQSLLERHPELKHVLLEETPWRCEAENEGQRYADLALLLDTAAQEERIEACLDKLAALQTPNGGWSWMPGMHTSTTTTLEVATLLARFNMERPQPSEEVATMLKKALTHLERLAHEEGRMDALDYLYFRTFITEKPGSEAQKDIDRMLKACEKQSNTESMARKARRAVVLLVFKKHEAAEIAVKSLLEHATPLKNDGRFFDTPRLQLHRRSFRIPAQVATLEALMLAETKGVQREETQGLLKWLILNSRTEFVTNCFIMPAAAARLLGELLEGDALPTTHTLFRNNTVVSDAEMPENEAAIGYSFFRYADKAALRADAAQFNFNSPFATAAVMAQYTLPAAEVTQTGTGMVLNRRLEVKSGDNWQPLADDARLTPGMRLRFVLDITTDRDYSYVALKLPRAAGTTPAKPLSGHTWQDGCGFYRAVGDASTTCFFDRMAKGTTTLTEEVIVTHSGSFVVNPASICSFYAPEYRAVTPALKTN